MTDTTRRILVGAAVGLGFVALLTLAIIYGRPLWLALRDPEQIEHFIDRLGSWAPLGLIALQVLQVVLAPLPGNVVAVVSGFLFGLGRGLLFCMIGVLLGSTVAFLLGRLLGRRVLRLFIPAPALTKFDNFMVTRGPFYVLLLLLVPNPIGDWLYYLAGLSAIPLPFFLLLVLIGRIPSNALETFLGVQVRRFGSQAYHLTWWQWALVIAVLGLIALGYYLNRQRIERLFLRLTRLDSPPS